MRIRSRSNDGGSDLVEGLNDSSSGVKIEFSDVWFRYPSRDAPVLNGLNMIVSRIYNLVRCLTGIDELQIGKGQFAAIVGPSGRLD